MERNQEKHSQNGIIMEFKVHDSENEPDLQSTANEALKQINTKNYAADLMALGFKEDCIRKYGFAFEGKKVFISS